MSRTGARLLSVLAVVLVAVLAVAWYAYSHTPDSARLRIQLRTSQIGDGIGPGTTVRLDGVAVGRITAVEPVDQGRQLLSVELDRSQTAGLTDALSVDYAPENLFGISAVTVHPGTGGTPLRPGMVIELGGRVDDVTMGALLRSLTDTATQVLTPKLTALLTQFSSDLRAFAPILRAVVTLARTVSDTQRYASSFLIDQYGSFLHGLGDFSSATFKLFDSIMNIEVFVNDRPKYDASVNMIANQTFPAVGALADALGKYFGPAADMLTPLLSAVAATVPDPAAAQANLTDLIDRLDRMFAPGPEGPAIDVAVTLRGVPGLAIPLLGQQAFAALTTPGAGR
ncbi:MlaD family protein [Nocardia yunnanensis]|uniref:MlaD family protein n=1 Tax=Nocardia yunnanensis TaxID=2382165 RepID=UPI0013C529EF|nr:MlaD family protein [Nocardia yunnanensis]